MPRKSRSPHPLRDIRTEAGVTQHQLAKWVGVSTATIQSIELGRLKLSGELAIKIMRQMGCALTSQKNENGKIEYGLGFRQRDSLAPYTRVAFLKYREALERCDETAIAQFSVAAARCIDLVFHSAGKHSAGTLMAFREDFEFFIARAFKDFNLAPYLMAIIRENWLPFNGGQLDSEKIEYLVANFPFAPLSTAASFPASFEGNQLSNKRLNSPLEE